MTTINRTAQKIMWEKAIKLKNFISYFEYYNYKQTPLLWFITYLQQNPKFFEDSKNDIWFNLYQKLNVIKYIKGKTDKNIEKQFSKIFPNTKWKCLNIDSLFIPANLLTTYWYDNLLIWAIKQSPSIPTYWHPIKKRWHHHADCTNIYTLNKKKQIHTAGWIETSLDSNQLSVQNLKECPQCKHIWVSKHLKISPNLDKLCCPSCYNPNKPQKENTPLDPNKMMTPYHSRKKSWLFYIQRQNKKDQTLPMGIEIEMHLKSNSSTTRNKDLWSIYKAEKDIDPKTHNFYFESDGSLNDAGVEMVTNPMTLKVHQDLWPKLLPIIREKFSGWYANRYGANHDTYYGIHITVNSKYWRPINIARLGSFLTNKLNYNFIMAIAQRQVLYQGFPLAHQHGKLTDQFRFKDKKITTLSKYQPINLQANGLMEIRIFSSTLNTNSFLKNIEFIDAFHRWSNETSYTIDYKEFIQWLNKQHEYLYPNILEYLNHDNYACKGLPRIGNETNQRKTIKSTWKTLIKPFKLGQALLFPTPIIASLDNEDRNECV